MISEEKRIIDNPPFGNEKACVLYHKPSCPIVAIREETADVEEFLERVIKKGYVIDSITMQEDFKCRSSTSFDVRDMDEAIVTESDVKGMIGEIRKRNHAHLVKYIIENVLDQGIIDKIYYMGFVDGKLKAGGEPPTLDDIFD